MDTSGVICRFVRLKSLAGANLTNRDDSMNNKTSLTSLILLTFLSSQAYAGAMISAKTDVDYWMTGIDGSAPGVSAGLDAGYQQDRFFIAGGINVGSFSNSTEQTSLGRRELDLTLGYQLIPNMALFAGLKNMVVDYTNTSDAPLEFTETVNTFGLGAYYSMPLAFRWNMVAAGALHLPQSEYKSVNQVLNSSGTGATLEAMISYRLAPKTNLSGGVKSQSMVLNYEAEGISWNTALLRFGVNLSHAF